MKQYLVTAYDHTDEGALERRMKVRPAHLDGIKPLRDTGNFVIGGAILNDDGEMIGSVMIMQFETEDELEIWKQTDPYIVQNIWERYEIKPFRVAQF
jgi:uncharacterized protein YciI